MKRILFFLAFALFFEAAYTQSILLNPPASPESSLNAFDLTEQVLIDGGECSSISNFTLKENPQRPFPNADRSWGYFEKGDTDFPFERGIILTTGYARRANGPTKSWQNLSDGSNAWPGDSDASVLAAWTTYNTTVFEFDFVPFGDEISFNYIFASSEYPSFSCNSSFNDVFGFIISGPGITPDPGLSGKNIALLPNGDWVTINNVNDDWCGDDTYYVAGPFQDIAHGGRTVPLTAFSEVIPFETYHIRLLVSDAGDFQADSAVFLEASSFSLGTLIFDESGEEIGDQALVCDETEFVMTSNVTIPEATFQWYFNDIPIPGATGPQYTATESGVYKLEVFAHSCSDTTEVTLVFNATPEVKEVEPLEKCDPSGSYIFDLEDFYQDISETPGAVFRFYFTEEGAIQGGLADVISDIHNFPVTGTVTIWVRVMSEGGCAAIVPMTLTVITGPETQSAEQRFCNFEGENTHMFDLTASENDLVISGMTGIVFEYYLDEVMTEQIADPENFTNTSNPQTVYVKITDTVGEDCEIGESILLEVDPFPVLLADEISICDDLNEGSQIVDLTDNGIVVTPGIPVSLFYFEADGTSITDPENYTVTSALTEITVTVRSDTGECEDSILLTIFMETAPDLMEETAELIYCSLSDYATFYLPDALGGIIIGDTEDFEISFHLSFEDARNDINPLPSDYTNVTPDQIVYVRVKNESGCYNIGQILLSTTLIHKELDSALTVCDDPYQPGDGIAVFDLTERNPEIEAILAGSFDIEFYTSLEDALAGTNKIQNPTEFENTENPQTIYARAIAMDGSCSGIVDFDIEVLDVPEFELPAYLSFCDYDTVKSYQLYGDFASYVWTDADGNVVSNSSEIIFSGEGIYTLEVTESGLECPARREIEIIFDHAPIILEVIVDGHTVTVVSSGGEPPVTYSYDNGLTWHGGLFYEVPGGIYELLAKSKYGCISAGKPFGVLGVPNVITPNGDGRNDVWEIRGVAAFPEANIKIFDRFGKKFVDRRLTTDFRWDGKYRGNPVASGDYWYLITLEDGKKIGGHISVRNQ